MFQAFVLHFSQKTLETSGIQTHPMYTHQPELLSIQRVNAMFGLFKKDPAKKLQKQYEKLLFDAMQLQRKGDIMGYSMTTQQAEKIREQIEALKE